jgi:hypothetical protein
VTILTVGIDLAKNVFAVHGRNEEGRAELLRPAVPRAKLLALIASLPPCVIAMEACSGAHHWARLFAQHGHTVRLIAPKFVTPYRRTGRRGKNDPNCLTCELTGAVGYDDVWGRMKWSPKRRHAPLLPVERMVRPA